MRIFKKNTNYEKYYKDLVPIFKKEKNQNYLTIILTLGVSIFFILFAISPTLSTIVKLNKQIKDAKFVEEKLTQKINNISTLSQEYQQIENDISYIFNAIPQNPQVPTLVGQIQTIGNSSSVTLLNIQTQAINLNPKNSTTTSFTFNITGAGSFRNIQTFLEQLLSMQRVVSISDITILENDGEPDTLTFTVKGSAYFKR